MSRNKFSFNHRQVFSENRFGGIIANKGDLDLCDE